MSASIALSLSGGGYRATLFHAGALRRLAELGALDRITHVSAVSGGAIAAGVWADDLRTHPGGDARDRARRIEARILAFCKEKIDTGTIIGGMLNPFKSVNETLIGAYRKHLFRDDPRLDQLPPAPRFTFCATNLSTGRQVYLERDGIRDYRVGEHPYVATLCEAVAASSAFPPFLSPMDLALDPALWRLSSHRRASGFGAPPTLHLTDGGAYDNLGLEPVWMKGYDYVLVSDAGAPYLEDTEVKTDWFSLVNAAMEIATDQSRGLRKRWLISRFNQAPGTPGHARGTYWGIASDVEDYGLTDAMPVKHAKSQPLRRIATRLAPFDSGVDERLVNWGYAMADTAMRKWRADLIAVTAPPPAWPLPAQSLA